MADDKIEIEIALKNAQAAVDALKKIGKEGEEAPKKTENAFKRMGDRVKAAWVGIGIAVAATVKQVRSLITAYEEGDQAQRQLEARLKSTGNAAGLTAEQIQKMAKELQSVTTFGDDAILMGQNMLLTFTKIGGDIFPQATEAMLDMAQSMGGDLQAASIQLGKALNDPVEGVSALKRVGVQLSEQQENQIKAFVKANDIASAQAIILKELNVQMGGTARAAAGGSGAIKQFANEWGDAQEELAGKIIPTITEILKLFKALPSQLKLVAVAITILIPIVAALNLAFGPVGIAAAALAAGLVLLAAKMNMPEAEKLTKRLAVLNREIEKEKNLIEDDVKSLQKKIDYHKKVILQLEDLIKKEQEYNTQNGIRREDNKKLLDLESQLTRSKAALGIEEGRQNGRLERLNSLQSEAVEVSKKLQAETQKTAGATSDAAGVMAQFEGALEGVENKQDEVKEGSKDLTTEIRANFAAANAFGGVLGEIYGPAGAMANSIIKIGETNRALKELKLKHKEGKQEANAQADALDRLALSLTAVMNVISMIKLAFNLAAQAFGAWGELITENAKEGSPLYRFGVILTDISKILEAIGTASIPKVIQAFVDMRKAWMSDEGAEQRGFTQTESQGTISAAEGTERNRQGTAGGAAIGITAASPILAPALMPLLGLPPGPVGAAIIGGAIGRAIAGRRAEGGPVFAQKPYMVGERGPEMFVPRTDGTIVPNGGRNVTVNIGTVKTDSPAQFVDQLNRYMRNNGVLA
jgi:hypothetical protein